MSKKQFRFTEAQKESGKDNLIQIAEYLLTKVGRNLEASNQEIKVLKAENNHLRMVADNVLNAMTENQRLTAENERLRAALLPFARAYTESSIKHPLPEIWFQVSGAVCKQAADALETEAVKP